MKRILILTFASIFLMNLFGLVTNAEVIYDNTTLNERTVNTGDFTSFKQTIHTVRENVTYNSEKKFTVTIIIPQITQGETIMPITLTIRRYLNTIMKTELLLQIENGEIVNETEKVDNATINGNTVTFTYNNTVLKQGAYGITTNDFCYEFYNLNENTDYVLHETENVLKIDNNIYLTAGDILIDNVAAAPKDVLREIVAILPVTLSVVITYIATRKGIAFVRSILESA